MWKWRRAALLSGSLAVLATSACGRGESAEDRQLAQIREELDRVQAERDAMDQRLNVLEIHAADDARARPTPVGDAAAGIPPLRVVRLRPDGVEDDGAAGAATDDDDANRPALSAAGSGGGGLGGGSTRGGRGAVIAAAACGTLGAVPRAPESSSIRPPIGLRS